jgi:hypothetical protein
MSRIEIPVRYQTLWATGDVRLWVEIVLLLKDAAGAFLSVRFHVDTASEITIFPAYRARSLGLPMPALPAQGVSHLQTGLEMRSGYLRFRVAGMDLTEYAVPCLFLGDPDTLPAGPVARRPRKLLQPLALVDHLRFSTEKDPASTAIYGYMAVEKK